MSMSRLLSTLLPALAIFDIASAATITAPVVAPITPAPIARAVTKIVRRSIEEKDVSAGFQFDPVAPGCTYSPYSDGKSSLSCSSFVTFDYDYVNVNNVQGVPGTPTAISTGNGSSYLPVNTEDVFPSLVVTVLATASIPPSLNHKAVEPFVHHLKDKLRDRFQGLADTFCQQSDPKQEIKRPGGIAACFADAPFKSSHDLRSRLWLFQQQVANSLYGTTYQDDGVLEDYTRSGIIHENVHWAVAAVGSIGIVESLKNTGTVMSFFQVSPVKVNEAFRQLGEALGGVEPDDTNLKTYTGGVPGYPHDQNCQAYTNAKDHHCRGCLCDIHIGNTSTWQTLFPYHPSEFYYMTNNTAASTTSLVKGQNKCIGYGTKSPKAAPNTCLAQLSASAASVVIAAGAPHCTLTSASPEELDAKFPSQFCTCPDGAFSSSASYSYFTDTYGANTGVYTNSDACPWEKGDARTPPAPSSLSITPTSTTLICSSSSSSLTGFLSTEWARAISDFCTTSMAKPWTGSDATMMWMQAEAKAPSAAVPTSGFVMHIQAEPDFDTCTGGATGPELDIGDGGRNCAVRFLDIIDGCFPPDDESEQTAFYPGGMEIGDCMKLYLGVARTMA